MEEDIRGVVKTVKDRANAVKNAIFGNAKKSSVDNRPRIIKVEIE